MSPRQLVGYTTIANVITRRVAVSKELPGLSQYCVDAARLFS